MATRQRVVVTHGAAAGGDQPIIVDVEPPPRAKIMFKVAAMVDGVPTSIFDGATTYPLGSTVFNRVRADRQGGLYCYGSVDECKASDKLMFPSRSALLGHQHRTILRVLAWNSEERRQPLTYGRSKRAFSFMRAVELIPLPCWNWTLTTLTRRPPSAPSTPATPASPAAPATPTAAGSGRTQPVHLPTRPMPYALVSGLTTRIPWIVDVEPPARAKVMFKVAAMMDGVPTSVFDGVTTYPIGKTVFHRARDKHQGGLYCFSSVAECWSNMDTMFPGSSALLGRPRVVLRVLAWNPEEQPRPLVYGRTKLAFSFLRAVQVISTPSSSGNWATTPLAPTTPTRAPPQAPPSPGSPEALRQGRQAELMAAARRGDAVAVQRLCEADPAVASCPVPGTGETALQLAAHRGDAAVCRVLLEQGGACAVLDVATPQEAMTPLHLAAAFGSVGVCLLLLGSGADLGARDAKAFTPLHHAALRGHAQVVTVLMQAGAAPEDPEPPPPAAGGASAPESPLALAVLMRHAAAARALIQGGASLSNALLSSASDRAWAERLLA